MKTAQTKKPNLQAATRELRKECKIKRHRISMLLEPVAYVLHISGVCEHNAMLALSGTAAKSMVDTLLSVHTKHGIKPFSNAKGMAAFRAATRAVLNAEGEQVARGLLRWAE